MLKRGLGAISPLFHNTFNISVTSGGKLLIHLVNVAVFLNSATLICRGTDISKCFKETLGIRDNESRLYFEKHSSELRFGQLEWASWCKQDLTKAVSFFKNGRNSNTAVKSPWVTNDFITKTRLHNFDPLKPHFYIVKLGFTGVYIIFLISAQKHRLWVLVRTSSARRF